MAQTYHTYRHHPNSYTNDRTDWKAAAWAGGIAGAVFGMAEMLMAWMFMGQSPWGPPRMIAAMLMGKSVLPPPAAFEMGIMMMAMAIHFMLSIVLGMIFSWIVHRLSGTSATAIGVVFGLTVYFVNSHLMLPFFTGSTQAHYGVNLANHLIYGVALGSAYAGMRQPKAAVREQGTSVRKRAFFPVPRTTYSG